MCVSFGYLPLDYLTNDYFGSMNTKSSNMTKCMNMDQASYALSYLMQETEFI